MPKSRSKKARRTRNVRQRTRTGPHYDPRANSNAESSDESTDLVLRHMLDANRPTIVAQWDQIMQFEDPVYMLVDASSEIGQALVTHVGRAPLTETMQANLRAARESGIPTMHLIMERCAALKLCHTAGFETVQSDKLLGIKGRVVPVNAVALDGLMTYAVGGPNGPQIPS
jgi:hypothetical protein